MLAAKAFGLEAIDMVHSMFDYHKSNQLTNHMIMQVCINYKDMDYLKDECEDGRRLGFTGKVASSPIPYILTTQQVQ